MAVKANPKRPQELCRCSFRRGQLLQVPSTGGKAKRPREGPAAAAAGEEKKSKKKSKKKKFGRGAK